jgi:hypothetical protein
MVQAFQRGAYGNYRAPAYSNLEMTKQASVDFHDPQQSARLYGPLAELVQTAPSSSPEPRPAPIVAGVQPSARS